VKSTVYSLCLLTLAATGCLEAPPPATRATAQPIRSGLSFERLDGTDVAGRFADRDTTIDFASHVDALVTAKLALRHGDVLISYDPKDGEAGTMTLDVRAEFDELDRLALGDFALALDRAFPYERDPEQRGGALLRTYAGLLESWDLGPMRLVTPVPLLPKEPNDGGGDPGPRPRPPAKNPPPPPPPAGAPPPPPGCQRADDNGVVILLACCGGGRPMPWQHDAGGECFTTNVNFCGIGSATSGDPLATACPGRCGPGCASLPLYTQDCLDHDLCLMHHPGLSSTDPTNSCGDELLEAVDDVAFVYASGAGFWIAAFCGI